VTGVFSVFKRLLESVSRKREVAVKRIRALEKTLAEKGTENERVRAAHEEREREFQRERERLEKDLEERNALIAILEGDLQAAVHGGVDVEQIADEK
jgi:septal ring factor EnvC (AmiA/AmiB activator)